MNVLDKVMQPSDGAAWITGASGGIGRAVALRLASAGWDVFASARRLAELQELAAEAKSLKGNIIPLPLDVADLAATRAAVAEILSDRPVALAILNAGIYTPMRAIDFDGETAARMLRVNLEGITNALDPLLPHMIGQKTGHIALTASVAGYRGLPDAPVYSATKAGLIAMAEALAMDGQDLGIRISVINPGFVETEATSVNGFQMPFLMQPQEAADAIVDGLKKPGFEIAFPGIFVRILRVIGLLPNRWYIGLLRKLLNWDGRKADR